MAAARGDIADGFQPDAAQPARDRVIRTEREDRQRRDRSGLLAGRDDPAMGMARQRPCAGRRAGDRRADDKALPRQRAAQRIHQRRLAAEQMRAAGDVQEQTMRRIERHQRREAIAPVGDAAQGFAVGYLIGIEHVDLRTDRTGIGQRQPDRETNPRGCIIQRGDDQRIVLFGDDDARKPLLHHGRA